MVWRVKRCYEKKSKIVFSGFGCASGGVGAGFACAMSESAAVLSAAFFTVPISCANAAIVSTLSKCCIGLNSSNAATSIFLISPLRIRADFAPREKICAWQSSQQR